MLTNLLQHKQWQTGAAAFRCLLWQKLHVLNWTEYCEYTEYGIFMRFGVGSDDPSAIGVWISVLAVLSVGAMNELVGAFSIRGRPDENALLRNVLRCFGRPSTQILKTQRLRTHFFDSGSQGGKIRKSSPPIFLWTANPHTFQNDDAIAPLLDLLPSTSEPRDIS